MVICHTFNHLTTSILNIIKSFRAPVNKLSFTPTSLTLSIVSVSHGHIVFVDDTSLKAPLLSQRPAAANRLITAATTQTTAHIKYNPAARKVADKSERTTASQENTFMFICGPVSAEASY